jgi:hypothetical protein
MVYVDLVFVLIIVSLAAVGLSVGRLRPGPWPAAVWFFLLLFFGTWALGAWLQPIGPTLWGTRWVPYVIAAVGISLLLAAATVLHADRDAIHSAEERVALQVTTRAYLWAAIAVSVVAIALRYVTRAF